LAQKQRQRPEQEPTTEPGAAPPRPAESVGAELRQLVGPEDTYATPHLSAYGPYATVPPPAFDREHAVGTPLSGPRYRILRPHAQGGMGQIFVAHDEALNREVALKELWEGHAHSEEVKARFLLEAEITARLEHPGVVPVYSLGQYADGRFFYAMRFL